MLTTLHILVQIMKYLNLKKMSKCLNLSTEDRISITTQIAFSKVSWQFVRISHRKLACCRDTVTRSNGFNIIRNRAYVIIACLASTGSYSQELRRRGGLHNRMNTKKILWVYTRVQHVRMQHRVFVWVYMNKHIPTLLRSVSSNRRSPQTLQRSTKWHCALDMCNTAKSFTHESNACVIRRLTFLNLGFGLLSCIPLPATLLSHHLLAGRKVLVQPQNPLAP